MAFIPGGVGDQSDMDPFSSLFFLSSVAFSFTGSSASVFHQNQNKHGPRKCKDNERSDTACDGTDADVLY